MFVATLRWEYRVTPASPTMRFACVSDMDEYRELLQDPTCSVVHYFEPKGSLTGSSAEAFELIQCTVDGKPRPARRSARAGSQQYTVNVGTDAGSQAREVTVAYSYRVLVQKNGHLLHLDISRPTKGLRVQLAYGNCGIRYVNALDYIGGSTRARISRLPASDPTPSVEIGFDGWVLPKAGVAFVWVLESELR